MSKELESLNYVWYNYYTEELSQDEVEQIEKHLNIVQDGLKRLESIENTKPSEAIDCLKWIIKNYIGNDYYVYEEELITIKQALLKSQEQEKVLEIIKNKNVVVEWFTKKRESEKYFKLEIYNAFIPVERQLTQEEFDLLKRYCK